MNILVGKTFGIGNAILSVPMIKALSIMGHRADVLVGSTPDDFGAAEIFLQLQEKGIIGKIFVDAVFSQRYDAAIMSIPFDGRWVEGSHYHAEQVLDCRRRPGNVDRLGFDMWKRHEIEYQMDNVRWLGYQGETPSTSFWMGGQEIDPDLVYLGIGYKRDPGGFGLSKHWGNDRFVSFMKEVRRLRPSTKFVSTGGVADLIQTGKPLCIEMEGWYSFPIQRIDLRSSLGVLSECCAYFGNDTGMMHAAASMALPTYGVTPYPDLLVKNPPWCPRSRMELFGTGPEEVAADFVKFVWGDL